MLLVIILLAIIISMKKKLNFRVKSPSQLKLDKDLYDFIYRK